VVHPEECRHGAGGGVFCRVSAADADRRFLDLLLCLLRKSHFMRFSARDVAMALTLNSDYLGSLFIRAKTSRLDRERPSAPGGTRTPSWRTEALARWHSAWARQAQKGGGVVESRCNGWLSRAPADFGAEMWPSLASCFASCF
jgi:hypothetical protein